MWCKQSYRHAAELLHGNSLFMDIPWEWELLYGNGRNGNKNPLNFIADLYNALCGELCYPEHHSLTGITSKIWREWEWKWVALGTEMRMGMGSATQGMRGNAKCYTGMRGSENFYTRNEREWEVLHGNEKEWATTTSTRRFYVNFIWNVGIINKKSGTLHPIFYSLSSDETNAEQSAVCNISLRTCLIGVDTLLIRRVQWCGKCMLSFRLSDIGGDSHTAGAARAAP